MKFSLKSRRLIPILFAASVVAVSSTPIWTNFYSEREADLLSLGIAVGGFMFKASLFYYMRHRMVSKMRRLTVFGQSIVDHWTGIVIFDTVMAGVFLTLFSLTLHADKPPRWLVLSNRSAINGCVALVICTGCAVAWEMHKVLEGDLLSVHEIENWDKMSSGLRVDNPENQQSQSVDR